MRQSVKTALEKAGLDETRFEDVRNFRDKLKNVYDVPRLGKINFDLSSRLFVHYNGDFDSAAGDYEAFLSEYCGKPGFYPSTRVVISAMLAKKVGDSPIGRLDR